MFVACIGDNYATPIPRCSHPDASVNSISEGTRAPKSEAEQMYVNWKQ